MSKPIKYLGWALLAPLFFWITHYMAVFPHEFAHGLFASLFGFKNHFWQITYGGTSWPNLLFLVHIDQNVNNAAIHAAGKDWLIALIAFAGPGFGNGLTYGLSLWLLSMPSVKSRPCLFYFFFWWNVNSIGNFLDYVPSRTFASHGDMGLITYGLHISPWWLMFVLGYPIIFVVWHFYSNTLLKTYTVLQLNSKIAQLALLAAVSYLLFALYGAVGQYGYGSISNFVSLLSTWLVGPVIAFCWPWRDWVKGGCQRLQALTQS